MAQGATYMTEHVKSYPELITSRLVLIPVIEEVGLSDSTTELAEHITAEVPMDTTWVDVTVRDTDPGRAARTATAVADEFVRAVATWRHAPDARYSPVHITVVDSPTTPTTPDSPV